ncbi:MAG: DUF3370 family protein [Cyanobacteriota bacterium]|nr:DUF3370 family protein [Cyanobacteriota bacterium]
MPQPSRASYVALMAGQTARPLQGHFNAVPVLHSNQPEEVTGPGILIATTPGSSYAVETGQPLANATFTFQGEFGAHIHHKYFPSNPARLGNHRDRGLLTLATLLINPSNQSVRIRFQQGAVRNSFEAPYLPNHLLGVKPLGPRPWNTGPGDATAVQMLRGRLDQRLPEEVVLPPGGRTVLFRTELPARGIANGLLKGHSDGPFQMAVVAAEDPQSDQDLLAVLDRGVLAPGRIYLNRIADIQNRTVFSRVGGVAIGDAYTATLSHDLSSGPLHVPLTSTNRHHFGTREVQVNGLASRMLDSSLDNVGTYGVRFDVDLNVIGSGPYELVLSHPTANGRPFTAFRGSIGITTREGYREVHVGLRSGESLSLASLNLQPGVSTPIRISLVYPADSTPGHLLSVVPSSQLAMLQERERQLQLARAAAEARAQATPNAPPPLLEPEADLKLQPSEDPAFSPRLLPPEINQVRPAPATKPKTQTRRPGAGPMAPLPLLPPPILTPPTLALPGLTPGLVSPQRMNQSLIERYRDAVEAQQELLKRLMGR